MGKFYVVKSSYEPNTAPTNRFLGMLKVMSQRKIETEVVFFMSDKHRSRAPEMPHIHYNYYWDKFDVNNSKLKNLIYLLITSKNFIKRVKADDIVYLYGCNELIEGLVDTTHAKIFHERTEHPLVSKLKFLNINRYLKACSKLSGLFVISTGLKEFFSSVGVPEEKIHIINMTVDTSRFDNLQCNPSERYVAYCGKATNNKDGVDQLIKAFAIVSEIHSDVKLYIIGTPPKKSDESGNLELVEKLGIVQKVNFTGVIPAAEIPQLLMNAEVLALARPNNMQAQYGFPTKLGEYLSTGNPVVLTNVGDISLFLKDNESALISEPNSLEDFARKLNSVLDNPTKAKIIGENGRKVALRHFNCDIETNKMINIIFNTNNND